MSSPPGRKGKKVLDRELWDWYNGKRSATGAKCSKAMLQARAKWAFHNAGMLHFKASDGWYRRFIFRWRNRSVDAPTESTSSIASTSTVEPTITPAASNSIEPTNTIACTSSIEHKSVKESINNAKSRRTILPASAKTPPSVVTTLVDIAPTRAAVYGGALMPTSSVGSTNAEGILNLMDSETDSMLETSSVTFKDAIVSTGGVEPTSTLDLMRLIEAKYSDLGNKTVYVSTQNETDINNLAIGSNSFCSFEKDSSTKLDHLSNVNNMIARTVGNNSADKSFKDCASTQNNYGSIFNANGFSAIADADNNDGDGMADNCLAANIAGGNETTNYGDEYEGEIIDCLSKFIDTSELSQTSMDFLYDSEDSSFSTTQNAFLLAETENQSKYEDLARPADEADGKATVASKAAALKMRHRKRGERYLPQFKERVLAYVANKHTMRQAAAKYKMDEVTISAWRRDRLARDAAGPAEGTPADEQFLMWLRRCRERGVAVTSAELRAKAEVLRGAGPTPKWFDMWTHRLVNSKPHVEGAENPSVKKGGSIKYVDAFKLEVSAFADARSQAEASRLFGVSRRRVFDWLRAYRKRSRPSEAAQPATAAAADKRRSINLPLADVDEMLWTWYQKQEPRPDSQEVRAKGRALYATHGLSSVRCSHGWFRRWCVRHGVALRHQADPQLLQWALTQMEANKTLSHLNLQAQALRLAAKQRTGFKASAGWALRFCRRHPHLLARPPSLATPLPPQLAPKVARFRCSVRAAAAATAVPLAPVGSMDEVHLSFAVAAGGCKRPLLLRKSDMDNCHATVVLACLSDGNLLPPAIIVKSPDGSAEAETEAEGGGLVWYQADARLDNACMAAWLDRVWFARVPAPCLLVVDCYPPHSAPAVKQAFAERASGLKVIPGGCASKLHPLGVSIAAAFNSLVMKQWAIHNAQGSHADNPPWDSSNKFQMPAVQHIAKWVDNAYRSLQETQQETIRRCFLATGLTVAANHSEDHFIENLSMIPADTDAAVVAGGD